ncbi:FERM domain-containing protein 5 isoform X1 [Harmonia axyridis]|uniref:FERM domain-containing protein 5 isoform X1 n=1 Tax=Harmonia axyridis TaxID=115357 RepID=UPI001E275C3A|nr:FERM domain-containing protein 5 isoform X1 [Harmonia axyridis]
MLKFGSKHDSNIIYKCTVRLLEDTEILECEYRLHHKGKYLLDYVCQQLNLVEQDYFGLRYVDITNQRHWLDLEKSIYKQVKDLEPVLFSFRVKFYPPDPFKLKEEITRYQIFLQLKRDLLHGRLCCRNEDAAMLAALVVQSELGDYDPDIHEGSYISDLKILLKQTPSIEEKAMEIHQKKLKGEDSAQIETKFLKLACPLDSYGIDPHPVKFQDHKSNVLYLGINYSGILTIQGSKKTHHFKWSDIQKLNYEGKMFIIHLGVNEKKHTVGFKCATGASCRHIWRCAVEQMLFFTLPTGSDSRAVVTGGGLFSWGTKFKYSGRTEREILESSNSLGRDEPSIKRTSSLRRKASSVPATPSTPLQPHLGYSTLPRSSQSDTGGSRMETSNSTGFLTNLDNFPIYSDVAALETVTEDHETLGLPKLHTSVLKDDSLDHFSDYYMKDSFDHSSSESQLVDSSFKDTTNLSYRSSRSQTPQLSHSQVDGRICLPNSSHHVQTNVKKIKKFYVIRRLIPISFVVMVLVVITTIVICETDLANLGGFKDIPELISLRYQLYEPLKQYFKSKMSS